MTEVLIITGDENTLEIETGTAQTLALESAGPQGPPGEGIPAGGTTGQVLKKASGDDYDTEWEDESGSAAVDSVNGQTGVVVLDQDDIADGTTNKAYTATEKTKLAGITTGATANSTDAQLRDRSTHTGTQSADTLVDGTTNKAYTATEKTKLSGIATGATANSSDATLLARTNHTGTQLAVTISDFSTAADARITAQKAQNSGLATLDSGGKIPTNQLPALAITSTFVVANQAAQLALTAQEGDVAVRTDQNKSYIQNGGSAGTMADWQELLTPTDSVLSVNGSTGAVTLTTSDITEGSRLYYTNARGIASTLTGYTSGAGVVASTDTILQAIQKINGNVGALVTGVSSVNSMTGAVTVSTITGNAGTATALATGRAINGVTFDGTAAITVTAAAGTLTGATLASGVTASSLTSLGTQAANLIFTDNTYDIGASGATRPRTAYIGTSIFSPLYVGSTSSGGNLTLSSTSHATKGNVILGSASAYDEVNDRLGIGTTSPAGREHIVVNSLGVTPTLAGSHILENTTAAAAGAQQVSPSTYWRGQGWKTTATAASQTVDYRAFTLPVQGTTNPTGLWKLQSSINGAAFADVLTVDSAGMVTSAGGFTTSFSISAFNGVFSGLLRAAAASTIEWASATKMASSSDGVMRLSNNAATDFGRLQFGGTTSSFPSLKRSSTTLAARLADDSADAPFTAAAGTFSGILESSSQVRGASFRITLGNAYTWNSGCQMFCATDGIIRMTDAAGTNFTRLQFGGTTSSFPSLKRSTTTLAVRLADDSGDAGLTASNLLNSLTGAHKISVGTSTPSSPSTGDLWVDTN